jgi:hypothetical protein
MSDEEDKRREQKQPGKGGAPRWTPCASSLTVQT